MPPTRPTRDSIPCVTACAQRRISRLFMLARAITTATAAASSGSDRNELHHAPRYEVPYNQLIQAPIK
eukprot:363474-Chlamydomonas_euryale.AAC.22